MQIITQEGIKAIEVQFNTKLLSSDRLNKSLKFWFDDSKVQKEFHYQLKLSGVKYSSSNNITTVIHEHLPRLIDKDFFTEERIWMGAGEKIFLCKEMSKQHLSNTVHYCKILITLGKLDEDKFNHYMEKLQESVVPELQDRFEGDILDYVPFYDWEKVQYEEYLKIVDPQEDVK